MNQELQKQAESLIEQIPEEHRQRGTAAAFGAGGGAILGSIFFGPVGAMLCAAIGGAIGVAANEKANGGGLRGP